MKNDKKDNGYSLNQGENHFVFFTFVCYTFIGMRSERLFEILFILLNKKRTTAHELAKKFAVSPRTVYRDIDILSCAGIPLYTMQGTGGGIFIDEAYTIDKSIVTKEEQEKILLALQCLSPVDEMHTESILNRLSAVFQRNADWVKVDYSRWNTENDTSVFDTIKQAVLECKAIVIEYLDSYGKKTKRTVYPLRLLFKSKAWYVESYCTEKKDFRLFRLTRILSIRKMPKIFNRAQLLHKMPRKEDAQASQSCSNIRLKCTDKTAYRLYDEFPAECITKNKDRSYTLSACLPIDSWLCAFILSLGTDVKIVQPESLKRDIAAFAEKIAEHHKKSDRFQT